MEEENGTQVITKEQAEELIEAKTIEANRLYIERLKQTLDFIEEMDKKPDKDRLAYANMINYLIDIMLSSVQGWQKWCNLNSMDTLLKIEEFKEIVPKMKKLVMQWIEIDISITEAKTCDVEKEHEEKKTKKKKTKTSYVS